MDNLDCIIPALPQSAWRLIIDYLQCDHHFCNDIVPYFYPLGFVRLYIRNAPQQACSQHTRSRAALEAYHR